MTDIKKVWLLYLKGGLMFLVGFLASLLLISIHFEPKTILLLAFAIWGFCRAYYFAFYVIEHYIDPSYRYSGLIDFLKYSIKKRFRKKPLQKFQYASNKRITFSENTKRTRKN